MPTLDRTDPGESPFTDAQWYALCDAHMGEPVPLAKAALYSPFVYSRQSGVFSVPMGHHQLAMTTLLAWQHGLNRAGEVMSHLGLRGTGAAADLWLEATEGAAFRSSVGRSAIYSGRPGNLSAIESRLLGPVTYLFNEPWRPAATSEVLPAAQAPGAARQRCGH